MTVFAPLDTARRTQELRPADAGQYLTEIRPGRTLAEADRARWARLTARAGSDNIFAADWFMASALRHCAQGSDIRLAVVRSLDGEWLGVLPLTFEVTVGRCPLPTWHSWLAANQFDAAPLIARGCEHIFWHCLLTHFDRHPGIGLALVCEHLPLDDPATHALIEVCIAQNRRFFAIDRFTRAMRDASALGEDALAARRKLDRRLDGLHRKLAREVGEPRFVGFPPEADLGQWIDRFLMLERSGWKGMRASALGCDARTAGFFRQVIRIAQQQGSVRLMSLEVAGQPLAMTSWFVKGSRQYGFKMAYDERFRAYAPGRLLMRAVADEARCQPGQIFDSCARRDAPPDPLWPQRRELVSYTVSIGSPLRRGALATVFRVKELYAKDRGEHRPGEVWRPTPAFEGVGKGGSNRRDELAT